LAAGIISILFIKEILEPGSARWKKIKAWASGKRKFVDAAAGDQTRCIVYMTSGHAILCSLRGDLVKERIREIFLIIIKDSQSSLVILSINI